MASASRTIDHEQIRRWAEQRGGKPAHVKRTSQGDDPGVLRIDFPGFSGEGTLEEIPWEQWFDWFDRNGLAFLFQDDRQSRFSKLVRRTGDEADEAASAHRSEGAGHRDASSHAAPARRVRRRMIACRGAGRTARPSA